MERAGTEMRAAGWRGPAGPEGHAGPVEAGGRYADWFVGGSRKPVQPAVPQAPVQAAAPMTRAELARQTLQLLSGAGEQFHGKVESRLPEGHRMKKAILAELLEGIPYLGTCRIGRVPLYKNGTLFSVAEFYVTNFDAKLSTRSPHFFNYGEEALKGGAMFYGVGIVADKYGRRLAFDRRFGDEGLYFQTKEEAVALYAMASIATGKSIAELKQLDRNNFPNAGRPQD